tara:strand:+ start:185 stop:388 length:204 start_codon:yes stop_codon:yes gene_type:complete
MTTIETSAPVIDPVIAEVRRHKREIAAAFDGDVIALGRALQAREAGDPRFAVKPDERDDEGGFPSES